MIHHGEELNLLNHELAAIGNYLGVVQTLKNRLLLVEKLRINNKLLIKQPLTDNRYNTAVSCAVYCYLHRVFHIILIPSKRFTLKSN